MTWRKYIPYKGSCWGNQAGDYFPDWNTYKNHSQVNVAEPLPNI